MRSQLIVCETILKPLWPSVVSAGSGRGGVDALNTPGAAVEVKARREMRLPSWLRQAASYAEDGIYPVLFYRPDGMGEASIFDWPTIMRAGDWQRLAKQAGLGGYPE